MTQDSSTVIFWGAGATATLGMRLTAQQGKFLHDLATGERDSSPLIQRVTDALGDGAEPWVAALVDLLTILGDENEESHSHTMTVTKDQMNAMRRNWSAKADDDGIRNRILTLRTLYDWPALKAVIKVSPVEQGADSAGANFLTDLFNILDIHGQSGHGFRAEKNES